MNQELRKWRERSESVILSAMKNPDNLDAIQNGTMGMPESVRRRQALISLNNLPLVDINNPCSISNINYGIQKLAHQPKIIRRLHYDFDVLESPASLSPTSINNRSVVLQSPSSFVSLCFLLFFVVFF